MKRIKKVDSLVSVTDITGISKKLHGKKLLIHKNLLDKRAKMKLELENIIKNLKHPSESLKNIRAGCEDPEDIENRILLLTYSQFLNETIFL